jgi:hypothetical protein
MITKDRCARLLRKRRMTTVAQNLGRALERHMADADRNLTHAPPAASPDRTKEHFAAGLLAMLAVTLALHGLVPVDALTPVVATLMFALAAGAAVVGVVLRDRLTRMMWFDAAGIFTFAGAAVSIMIEPDQLVRLVPVSNPSD